MEIEHYLTYQHNVQKYFYKHLEKYSGIVIPMPIAVSFPGGTYGFVRALCSRDKTKRYGIDPRTPLFQKAWNRDNVRPPHEKMAGILGGPFTSKGLTSQVDPADLGDEELEEVVKRCLDFQMNFRTREEDAKKLRKYAKLLGVDKLGDLREPQFLIPPYLQFASRGDAAYVANVRATAIASSEKRQVPLRPVVHFTGWSSVDDWEAVYSDLVGKGATEAWVYPNNFREHSATEDDLARYRQAVEKSKSSHLNAYALFGGYFAIIMGQFGLRGFSNGVGYGEWRDSGYHRGGTASLRVYVPRLHRYLDAPEAQNLVEKDPDTFASEDDLIARCHFGGRRFEEATQEEWLDHFLDCRHNEIAFVAREGVTGVADELSETVEALEAIGPLEHERYGTSLTRWKDAVS